MSQASDHPSSKQSDDATLSNNAGSSAQIEIAFDDLNALLGGANAAQTLAKTDHSSVFAAALDAPRAWLSPGVASTEPSDGVLRQFALEVASLKLRCFDALIRQLIAEEHLRGLPIARVIARLTDQPGALRPARWGFELALAPPTGATGADTLGLDLSNLLARLMFANDQRSPAVAEELMAKATDEFSAVATRLPNAAIEDLDQAATAILSSADLAASHSVLHGQQHRSRVAVDTISPNVWMMWTKMALKLRTRVAGFSFADHPLLDLLGELSKLALHLDVATFGAIARRDAITAVLRTELGRLEQ